MADKCQDDSNLHLTPNQIIKKLASPDALHATGGPPDRAIVLVGFLGEFAKSDTTYNIYPELDLAAHYRVPKGDVLHAVAGDAADPTQPTRFYVRSSAVVEFVQTREASFLEGNIADKHEAAGGTSTSPHGFQLCQPVLITTGPTCRPSCNCQPPPPPPAPQ